MESDVVLNHKVQKLYGLVAVGGFGDKKCGTLAAIIPIIREQKLPETRFIFPYFRGCEKTSNQATL